MRSRFQVAARDFAVITKLVVSIVRSSYKLLDGYAIVVFMYGFPTLLAARSKACVCIRSLSGVAGSNPAGEYHVSCERYVLLGGGLCDGSTLRPRESYRV